MSQTTLVTGMMLGAGALALGTHVSLEYVNLPIGAPRYGSGWHKKRHEKGWSLPKLISGSTYGRMAHVRAVVPAEGQYVKVFGHVCDTCGYVSVSRTLDPGHIVEDEVFGRSTYGYTWTTVDQIDRNKIENRY